jgi:hypothetical protein
MTQIGCGSIIKEIFHRLGVTVFEIIGNVFLSCTPELKQVIFIYRSVGVATRFFLVK